ncbi:MAG: V4R domain-containing protein [Gemmatimonadota bacterium]
MTNGRSGERDLTLPASALRHLGRMIRREAGSLGGTHALQDAGFAAGEDFLQAFADEVGEPLGKLPAARFWTELDAFFEVRGWGRVEQVRLHPAFGVLHAHDWGESDPAGTEAQPGCAFSAGVLARMLGSIAGGPVAVLEVGCRSRGDGECSFLVGSELAIHEIYGHLLDGAPLDVALQKL